MSGSSGSQTSTQTTGLPTWEQPYANQYLASMLNYVFPSNVPQNYFNTSGFGTPAQSAQQGGGTAAGQMMNQIDPTGTASSLLAPVISGSPYLQQMAAQNPGAIVGASSPMAAAQLSNPNIYGSSNPYLSWIPGLSLGLGGSGGGGQSQGIGTYSQQSPFTPAQLAGTSTPAQGLAALNQAFPNGIPSGISGLAGVGGGGFGGA